MRRAGKLTLWLHYIPVLENSTYPFDANAHVDCNDQLEWTILKCSQWTEVAAVASQQNDPYRYDLRRQRSFMS